VERQAVRVRVGTDQQLSNLWVSERGSPPEWRAVSVRNVIGVPSVFQQLANTFDLAPDNRLLQIGSGRIGCDRLRRRTSKVTSRETHPGTQGNVDDCQRRLHHQKGPRPVPESGLDIARLFNPAINVGESESCSRDQPGS